MLIQALFRITTTILLIFTSIAVEFAYASAMLHGATVLATFIALCQNYRGICPSPSSSTPEDTNFITNTSSTTIHSFAPYFTQNSSQDLIKIPVLPSACKPPVSTTSATTIHSRLFLHCLHCLHYLHYLQFNILCLLSKYRIRFQLLQVLVQLEHRLAQFFL